MLDLLGTNSATASFILINIALALSIYLTLSTGMLSLANAGFMAIGAYTTAVLASQFGLPLIAGFLAAMTIATVLALPLGSTLIRLGGVYLAIATIGFGEIVRIALLNGDRILRLVGGSSVPAVFNGAEGIILPYRSPALVLGIPETIWPLVGYVLVLIYLVATLRSSPYGRVLAAIRQDETAAATLGIDVVRAKLVVFVLGAVIAAGAGALSTPIVRVIDPRNYVFSRAVDILAFAVLGGTTSWVGPILGATILTALPEALRGLRDQRDVVNGVVIMLSVLFLPNGLADARLFRRRFAALRRQATP